MLIDGTAAGDERQRSRRARSRRLARRDRPDHGSAAHGHRDGDVARGRLVIIDARFRQSSRDAVDRAEGSLLRGERLSRRRTASERPASGDARLAEQRPNLGEEVRLGLDPYSGRARASALPATSRARGRPARRRGSRRRARELPDRSRPAPAARRCAAAPRGARCCLERAHLARHELRLACLLVVDTALHDEDAVRLEELARSRVRRVEDDHLRTAGRIVERDEHHRLAALRRHLLQSGDDAADGDELAVAPALEVREGTVGLPPQLCADAFERVLRDVQPSVSFSRRRSSRSSTRWSRAPGLVPRRTAPRRRRHRRRWTPARRDGRPRSTVRDRAPRRGPSACPSRVAPVESSAPHFTSDSSARFSAPADRRAR